MIKLDPEFKTKWVTALRGGEYKQGRLALRNKQDEFCCLGVACDLLEGRDSWLDAAEMYGGQSDDVYATRNGNVAWWTSGPALEQNYDGGRGFAPVRAHLANMNDNGKSFSEIADWIEENL